MKVYDPDKYEILLKDSKSVYLLGILWADGYLQKHKGRSYCVAIRLQKDDLCQIESLMTSEWGRWRVFDYKQPVNAKPSWKAMREAIISSRELCLFLEKYDFHLKSKIGPNKILNQIPKDLRHYFLRGYSDGDGCFYIRNNKLAAFSVSAPIDFDWNFLNHFPLPFTIRKKEGKSRSSSIIIECRKNIVITGEFLYQGEIFGLKRKYDKFLEIKQIFEEKEEKEKFKYNIDVISPLGEEHTVYNIVDFSLEHNLHYSGFVKMLNKQYFSYKGWRLKETSLSEFLDGRFKNLGREYLFLFNDKEIKIKNVNKFCREQGYSRDSFARLISGERKFYKGFVFKGRVA